MKGLGVVARGGALLERWKVEDGKGSLDDVARKGGRRRRRKRRSIKDRGVVLHPLRCLSLGRGMMETKSIVRIKQSLIDVEHSPLAVLKKQTAIFTLSVSLVFPLLLLFLVLLGVLGCVEPTTAHDHGRRRGEALGASRGERSR